MLRKNAGEDWGEELAEVYRPEGLRGRGGDLVQRPPAVLLDFDPLAGQPVRRIDLEGVATGDVIAFGLVVEVVFVGEREADGPDAGAEFGDFEAGLFKELAVRGLLVGFAGVNAAARREPEG